MTVDRLWSSDGPQLSSAAQQEQFADDWLEVESRFWWPAAELAGAQFVAPLLPAGEPEDGETAANTLSRSSTHCTNGMAVVLDVAPWYRLCNME